MGLYEDTEFLGGRQEQEHGGRRGGGLGRRSDAAGRQSLAGGGLGLYEDTEFISSRPVAAAADPEGAGRRGGALGSGRHALAPAVVDSPLRPGAVERADEFEVALQATPLKEQQAPLTPDKVGARAEGALRCRARPAGQLLAAHPPHAGRSGRRAPPWCSSQLIGEPPSVPRLT
jgi:hypothetical protein